MDDSELKRALQGEQPHLPYLDALHEQILMAPGHRSLLQRGVSAILHQLAPANLYCGTDFNPSPTER